MLPSYSTASRQAFGRCQREEVRRLRAGIENYLDGNYPTAAKNDKCNHGRYGFEGCENCIDEYFTQLLKETK